MNKIALLLLVILIFVFCAVIGYQVANQMSPTQATAQVATAGADLKGEQHKLVLVYVDQLGDQQPKLISVWFISLFFLEGAPPTLTFAQIYPTRSNPNMNQAIEQSFALDGQGDPVNAFWQTIQALKIKWEGFLIVDNQTAQRVMEWVNGTGNYISILTNMPDHPTEGQQLLTQTCKLISGISNRQTAPFVWGDLVPAHFRSNLRMEVALAYWNRVTTSTQEARCEILMAP
jgi:hypothetical protein